MTYEKTFYHHNLFDIIFSKKEKYLITIDNQQPIGNNIKIWEVMTGNLLRTFPSNEIILQ